jgi:hypothetical protein
MKIDPITRMTLSVGCIIGGGIFLMISQSIDCGTKIQCAQIVQITIPLCIIVIAVGLIFFYLTSRKPLIPDNTSERSKI